MANVTINLEQILKDSVVQAVKEKYLQLMSDEIERIENECKARIEKIALEHLDVVRKTANAMTLNILQRENFNGISVEFRL